MSLHPSSLILHSLARRRLTVTGVVQGVGFRPTVYTLARAHSLTGFVGNDSDGVFIEVEGPPDRLDAFGRDLIEKAPPLAHIASINTEVIAPCGSADFTIVHSEARPAGRTHISPDMAVCDDCRREMLDPTDRRYRYPFINCTNCGPRFTIIRDIPYDRPLTTMVDFPMCAACRAEYDDPTNRRFHAQPNACPDCGPRVWGEKRKGKGEREKGKRGIGWVQGLLLEGKVVAVKGLGGFHLACDAANEAAIARLRARKGRVDKPFAVMVPDVATARRFAIVSAAEEALLISKERPIVILRRRPDSDAIVSPLVAPHNNTIGVMLPYTPLHHLLFTPSSFIPHPSSFLIMTSANRSSEPIIHTNAAARERLAPLADAFLLHDRKIEVRCDDSVVREVKREKGKGEKEYSSNQAGSGSHSSLSNSPFSLYLRRSRGYAPFPVKLPAGLVDESAPILATGGELKATFCLTAGAYAYLSQHIGDMENLETLRVFADSVAHFTRLFRAEPALIACDEHPGYLGTRWAAEEAERRGVPLVKVQHHHAHVAALLAESEHPGDRPVLGFAFDGTGYGTDGAIWGGELLVADYTGFTRAAHLAYVPLPGGDAAVKRPYRMALAHLWAAGVPWDEALPCVAACPAAERRVIRRQLERGINTVPTSSMGRLFDAVAAAIGVRQTITYEAQAAIELEVLAAAAPPDSGIYAFDLTGDAPTVLDPAPVWRAIAADWGTGVPPAIIAARFHRAVADAILALAIHYRAVTGLNDVALTGGVFQNVHLLTQTHDLLQTNQFNVLTHRRVPPNDGGLALGQAAIAREKAKGKREK